jgi:surfactin family lipopeptide synthetase A
MTQSQSRILRAELLLPVDYSVPRTPTEKGLVDIWCTVLHMDRIGINDSYFDLGGDSLMAATMFAMVLEKFAITVPIATLFDAPTVAKLGYEIDRVKGLSGPSFASLA